MTRYVQRDAAGAVIGHYANPQSYATEAVPDNHPDIAAWHAAREQERNQPSPLKGLEARISALEAETQALKRVR